MNGILGAAAVLSALTIRGPKQDWIFRWNTGGFNSTHGATKEEALRNLLLQFPRMVVTPKGAFVLPGQVIREGGKTFRTKNLTVNMKTLRPVTREELRREQNRFA
jgi:hypothetical protein